MSSIMKEDWIEVELGDLLKLKNGFAFKASNYKKEGIPVFRIGDINDWIVSEKNAVRIDEKELYDDFIVETGDILIAMSGATTGKFGVYSGTDKAYQNQRVGNLKLYSENSLNKSYVFYLLYSLKRDIEREAYGGAQPNISGEKIEGLKTKLAPLPIQRAIVSKIEALFSDLDNGIANFRKAQEQLKMYRQAVLKKAFEGKLSELGKVGLKDDKMTDGENEEILPSQNPKNHNSDIKEDNLPKGWKWVKLGDVIIKIEAGKSFRCEERPPINNEVGVLKVSAVTWEEFSEVESKTIISDDKVNEAYFVKQGDFLFSRANTLELVGRSVIVNKIQKRLMLSDKTLRFQFSTDINPFYILYFLRTQSGRKQIESLSTGNQMSMRNIGQSRIKQIVFPLCSLPEQTQIVQEIESRLSVCDKMEQSISESIEKAEALRQSILKKAFEGKLLSETEIAQCKAAVDYEPAGELLKKIQAEKVKTRLIASQQKKKGGKNGK